ncbi:DUF551 domain-containing protein [Citrobacter freundii]
MTTNNHPAHGPVSLDRLHQIREILSKAAAQSDGGNLGYAMADAVKVIDGAIAAFDAEPVAWIIHARTGDQLTTDGNYVANAEGIFGLHSTPLYTTPPAPVALGTTEIISQLERVLDWILNTLPVPTPLTIPNARLLTNVINTCRAAMLQAGNSPVTPDGWIPVSERMPEDGQEVIVMDVVRGKVQSGMIYQDGEFVDFNEQYYKVKSPSHWMPLPAAPHFRKIGNSSTNNCREISETSTNSAERCWCRTCRPVTMSDMRFVVCPECGNKRCPRANDHRNVCTGSNEPGQIGSAYPASPQQEVK